ncbi:MAG: hypothetical protein GWM98_04740 [Nitrospinaceae bacterium]|nr:hypothetical protein [Deltaproteobacteria bacterium]NIY14227.1 hypothetical protein [Nitrospinaceae bacterium]
MQAPIDMKSFEDTVFEWFKKSTGIEAIWRHQAAPQLPYPFGSLSIISGPDPYAPQWETRTEEVAPDWEPSTDYAVGDLVMNDFPAKTYQCTTAGQSAASGGPTGTGSGIVDGSCVWDYYANEGREIKTTVCVPCRFSVSCQAYVEDPDSRDPTKDARAYIAVAQSALSLPSYLDRFRRANISVIRAGPVQNINEAIGSGFISRANVDVQFGATLSLEEFGTFIEKVELKSEGFPNGLNVDIIIGGS